MTFSVSKWSTASVLLAATLIFAPGAHANTAVDTSLVSPPGVYFGAGNEGTNAHWTVNSQGTVELGLIAIQRGVGNVYTPSGNVYTVPTGPDPNNGARAIWNFDFSINLRATGLNNSTLTLGDVTPTLTVQDLVHGTTATMNPLIAFGNDNSAYAPDGSTRNGNVTGQQATGTDVGAQNSENFTFGQFGTLGFDMNLDDTYLIALSLLGPGGADLGTVNIVVVAGNGGAVPIPAALPLFASGLGIMGFVAHRRKRKAAA